MSEKTIDVIWNSSQPPDIAETIFSYDFCRKTSQQLCRSQLNVLSWHDLDFSEQFALNLINKELKADYLLMVANPEVITGHVAIKRMMQTLAIQTSQGKAGCIFPVYNETPKTLQIAQLPAIYLNLTTYLEVSEMMPAGGKLILDNINANISTDANCIDSSCFLLKKEFVKRLMLQVNLGKTTLDIINFFLLDLMAQQCCIIDQSALVHAFGIYGGAMREDLAQLVPQSAKTILDVGCANGGFGEMMRLKCPDIELTGVEMNPVMAQNAVCHYNKIYTKKIETINFKTTFDHINCGDIIEHLDNPWQMIKLFYSILKKNGTCTISLPNAGHWTVVKDLANGKFEYIPFGLLCVTHIRWFTEQSIREALYDAGFVVDKFYREQIPPTPKGQEFIELMCQNGEGDKIICQAVYANIRHL